MMTMSTRFLHNSHTLRPAETAVLLFFALVTFRSVTLPSALASVAHDTLIYPVLIGFVLDILLAFLCLQVARRGGLQSLSIPTLPKRILSLLVGLFCAFKVAVYLTEAIGYCSSDLFDKALVWPLAIALLVGVVVLASKGYAGVGRTALVCSGVVAVMLILVFAFNRYTGYAYNLWSLLRPQAVGDAFWRSLLWVGDGVMFLFADTRSDAPLRRSLRPAILSALLSLLFIVTFYLLMVYAYGSAVDYLQYPFARLFVNASPESLGAVDWPVLVAWLIAAMVYLAALFCAAASGFRGVCGMADNKGWIVPILVMAFVFGIYAYLSCDKDKMTDLAGTLWANALLFALSIGMTVGAFAFSFVRKKEGTV